MVVGNHFWQMDIRARTAVSFCSLSYMIFHKKEQNKKDYLRHCAISKQKVMHNPWEAFSILE